MNIQPPWNHTLPIPIVPPALHMVKLVRMLAIANHDAVVPPAHAQCLQTPGQLLVARGLLGHVCAPALHAVHCDHAVVREASEDTLDDRAVEGE